MPFGAQSLVGVVLGGSKKASIEPSKLKPINAVLDSAPLISSELIELCQWCSDYYHHPLGEVLHAALPVQLRKDEPADLKRPKVWRHTNEGKGIPADGLKKGSKQQLLHQLLLTHIQLDDEDLKRLEISKAVAKGLAQKGLIEHASEGLPKSPKRILAEPGLSLSDEQHAALNQIRFHHFAGYLLEGTTGSGKTEVYLQAIARALESGKQALLLVPEIGLAPQTLQRFQKRFAVPIVELHSSVSEKQRTQNWLQASCGYARIVIGTRLSVFTPMPELGLIIIDEEHDQSFKQQEGLRYSARDVAVIRASKNNIPLLLGSATPSLESLNNAINQRYEHLRLTQRAGNAQAPTVELTDMRKEERSNGFAHSTLEAIRKHLQRGEQVVVFINRRGYAPVLFCANCGWSAGCQACDARMTLHSKPRHLRCHHCDHQKPVPHQCPSCHHPDLAPVGQGTEKSEELLNLSFPEFEVIRVDQDSMQRKTAMAELNAKLQTGNPCLLVGTQMLAKGHHFPRVTLVVFLDVDQGLFSSDFRGPERLAQQIVQVSGRAGRAELPGKVILQSFKPDHPMLQSIIHEGYHRFARKLLAERKAAQLPPICHMALIRAESKRLENAVDFLKLAAQTVRNLQAPRPGIQYLGPIPSLMEKRQDRFRYQLQINCAQRKHLHALLKQLIPVLENHALSRRTRWSIDVDPQDMA